MYTNYEMRLGKALWFLFFCLVVYLFVSHGLTLAMVVNFLNRIIASVI